jgi:putative NADH-flavin reductase
VLKSDAHLLEHFAKTLTSAMQRAAVKRVIIESVAFLFKDSIFPPVYLLGKLLFPAVVADSAAMERIVEASGIDWTIVRPPELTAKPYTGKYRVREGHLPRFGLKISRADVADYMIQAAENRSLIGKIVGIAN